jgi:decaprenylphospho-beta-D-ribofuranose 2-oxidase
MDTHDPLQRQRLTGWGRTAPSSAEVRRVRSDEAIAAAVTRASRRGVLVRGCGRSYGDAAQNGGGLVLDLRDRSAVLELDEEHGVVTVESGATLEQLMTHLLPHGWFLPTTPGTRQVTVGGAIAADVHGKNHHVDGSFGSHVHALDLMVADGSVRHLTPDDALFWATIGGMGLTGVILRATFDLVAVESAYVLVDTTRCADLDTVMAAMAADDDRHAFSVAWLDCLASGASLGRSVLTRGRFAERAELTGQAALDPLAFRPRPLGSVPDIVPGGVLGRTSVRLFNEAWFRRAPRKREGEVQHLATFFHPLDGVASWNRIYGPGGFLQYQVLVPPDRGDVVRRCVATFSRAGAASFLSVLKRMGPGNPGHLSFPRAGWTLTLDVPARSYLAKDSRMTASTFRAMYPRLPEWQSVRDSADPERVFASDLARRLGL